MLLWDGELIQMEISMEETVTKKKKNNAQTKFCRCHNGAIQQMMMVDECMVITIGLDPFVKVSALWIFIVNFSSHHLFIYY